MPPGPSGIEPRPTGNATLLNHTRRAVQTHVCILNELVYVFEDDPDSVPYLLYMHRFHYYRLIVPQSSKKQLLSVLSDPFDKYVWMISVVSVFILALFVKFARDRKLVCIQVFDTFVKLLGVGLMGTLIRPHSSIERFTLGLFMLMSIVLVSAYQSLVISFLLSTRFHPELDSLRQVNESCTWSHDAGNLELREAGFLHYGECDAVDMDEMSLNDQVKSMFEQKCCVEIPENVCEMYFKENIVNEYFRVSKVITRQLPVFALLKMYSPLHSTVKWYARAFHEAGLYHYVEEFKYHDPTVAKRHKLEASPVRVHDLSLVWVLYCMGLTLCVICISFNSPTLPPLSKVAQKPRKQSISQPIATGTSSAAKGARRVAHPLHQLDTTTTTRNGGTSACAGAARRNEQVI
ncbi:conserved hypothetical protein [Culex quinquefasciatus]|uniref:Ionotropic glutamate receptor C-terminal domain-containing protein n=1 Tax=Culex quinquefasciatus TaxID=7176 RepID=B0WMG9_CULQU|nr:conserved hypothetical protein [Culex quinquefasciatus]|eukprot:XP_001849903.1 conserved hypothetical protein [Culex quinquefasciatus]